MLQWFGYLRMASAIMVILTTTLPKAMEDGQLTIDELVEILTQLAASIGVPLTITLPPEVAGQVAQVSYPPTP